MVFQRVKKGSGVAFRKEPFRGTKKFFGSLKP